MGKCVKCLKKGLFFSVNSEGLCKECAEKKRKEEIEQQERELRRKQEYEKYVRRLEKEAQEIDEIPSFQIELSSEKIRRNTGFECPHFSNITAKGEYDSFVVFDTETTGLAASRDRIIELAAVKYENGKFVEKFQTYVNPERHIPEEASSVNHITDDMVKDAPKIYEVLPAFEKFIGNSLLVAYNEEFDLRFLYHSGSTLLDSKRKYICAYQQSKKLLDKPKMKYSKEDEEYVIDYDKDFDVEDYQLETVCDYFRIVIAKQHSALSDAYATAKVFLELIQRKKWE